MSEDDYDAFAEALDQACNALSRGRYTPTPENTALWFRSLAAHPLAEVRAGFDAHVKDPERGRFVPSPADILGQIAERRNADTRPGPEEAWATALRSADEWATVVWTAEIAQAKEIAQPLLDVGDEVGARMAFKEAYIRLVAEARRSSKPVQWTESLGFDAEQRSPALERAASAGLLPAPAPQVLLPGVETPCVPERVAAVMARYRAARAEAAANPLAWAKRLRDREQAGETLSMAQHDAWREALERAPTEQSAFTGFRPIPADLLPPAMRPSTRPRDSRRVPVEAYDEVDR